MIDIILKKAEELMHYYFIKNGRHPNMIIMNELCYGLFESYDREVCVCEIEPYRERDSVGNIAYLYGMRVIPVKTGEMEVFELL